MSKGTSSQGKHQRISHIRCRRCGRHSYHIQKKRCAACGYPLAKLTKETWKWKPINRSYRRKLKLKHQKIKTVHMGKRL